MEYKYVSEGGSLLLTVSQEFPHKSLATSISGLETFHVSLTKSISRTHLFRSLFFTPMYWGLKISLRIIHSPLDFDQVMWSKNYL